MIYEYQELYQSYLDELKSVYDDREAERVLAWIVADTIENKSNIQKVEAIELAQKIRRLLVREPVQYVLKQTYFYNLELAVDSSVLIPRPETEELVHWIVQDQQSNHSFSLLDIGTGSGCIALAVKKCYPSATVIACDVNEDALEIAIKNARTNHLDVDFFQMDFTQPEDLGKWGEMDVIVSNPPYVLLEEMPKMTQGTILYEPEIALFVKEEDALWAYRNLLSIGDHFLTAEGRLYLEINEFFSEELQDLLTDRKWQFELRQDMQGKDRMVKAWKR